MAAEPVLVATRTRWWQFQRKFFDRRWVRRMGPCPHPFPTFGDERMAYGLRCGRCFTPVEWVNEPIEIQEPTSP